jgi:hypothetical protein
MIVEYNGCMKCLVLTSYLIVEEGQHVVVEDAVEVAVEGVAAVDVVVVNSIYCLKVVSCNFGAIQACVYA